MKIDEKTKAIVLRKQGWSISQIASHLLVAKSSVSSWVRSVELTTEQLNELSGRGFTTIAIERRRSSRLENEAKKRNDLMLLATKSVPPITDKDLWLMGVMLYWAEGGKTQRLVRFSNGDPDMIKIMMKFFRIVCEVPEEKFRGYIHIHPHLDPRSAELYWSDISGIPLKQFFKTYRKPNISSLNKRDSLPYGVMDIYVLDTRLFLNIVGWAQGIFKNSSYTKTIK